MATEKKIWGMPLDAIETLKDDGSIGYDNDYDSQDFADWFKAYFSNGILAPKNASVTEDFKILLYSPTDYTQSGHYRIKVYPGKMVINGRTTILNDPVEFQVGYADIESGQERKDRIVVELDTAENANSFAIKVEKGISAAVGTATTFDLVREGTVYQMGLAEITMNAAGNGTLMDTRWITSICGISNVLIGVKPPDIVSSGTPASEIVFNPEFSSLDAENVQDAIDQLAGADFSNEFDFVLDADGWSTSNQQTVSVEGFTSSMTPIIDVIATTKKESTEWGKILRAVTVENGITFFAYEKPIVNLNVHAKVVR